MRLIITAEIEAKIHAYVRAVTTEIAGMGKAVVTPEGDIMLLDVAIYEQEVTGGTADLSTTALAKFQTELIKKGESPKDWIVWWHSHADMSAFFSGRDTATIDSSDEFHFLVSLVVNRKRERKARLDTYKPFRFTKEDLPIVVGKSEDAAAVEERIKALQEEIYSLRQPEFVVPEEIQTEVDEKVKVKVWSWEKKEGQPYIGFGKPFTQPFSSYPRGPHGGKVFPASSLDDNDDWPLSTPASVIDLTEPSYLDNDELYAGIEALKQSIQEHKNNGTEDSSACIDLRDELGDYEYALVQRLGADGMLESYQQLNEKN